MALYRRICHRITKVLGLHGPGSPGPVTKKSRSHMWDRLFCYAQQPYGCENPYAAVVLALFLATGFKRRSLMREALPDRPRR